jgi:hypothetical protein
VVGEFAGHGQVGSGLGGGVGRDDTLRGIVEDGHGEGHRAYVVVRVNEAVWRRVRVAFGCASESWLAELRELPVRCSRSKCQLS